MTTNYISTSLDGLIDEDEPDLFSVEKLTKDKLTRYFKLEGGIYTLPTYDLKPYNT